MDKWAKSGLLKSFLFTHFFYKHNNDTTHSSKLLSEIVAYSESGYNIYQIGDMLMLSSETIRRTIKDAKKNHKKTI